MFKRPHGLMLQFATSNNGQGCRRKLSFAKQGSTLAANVSSSARHQPLKKRRKGARPDTLYKAKAVGRSKGRRSAVHHDVVLYAL